ncbi:transcriptional regulator [Virgibacillus soli]|nr:transcriptional regulator [Virgibacillus soli]
MAKNIHTGRFTTENNDDIVVFLIGMRVNKLLAIHKWGPVFTAMPGMIKELYTHKKELGFLSLESYFGLRTTVMIQYWRSTDDLLAYAKGNKHLQAWKNFNTKVESNDAVGIYHETYELNKGRYESVYVNMPLYGLGKAMKHIPITKKTITATKRLKRYTLRDYS